MQRIENMALINCPECGNQMSDTAKKCPHCGYKEKNLNKHNKKTILGIILIILGISALVISEFQLTMSRRHGYYICDDEHFISAIILYIVMLGCGIWSAIIFYKQNKLISKVLIGLMSVAILVLLYQLIIDSKISTHDEISDREYKEYLASKENETATEDNVPHWTYQTNKADLLSINEESFNSYDKGHMLITLDHSDGINGVNFDASNMVILGIVDTNGNPKKALFDKVNSLQYNSNKTPSNAIILAVFNDGYKNHYNALCGSDQSALAIMDRNEVADFINHLKKSTRCEIAVNFSNYHSQKFQFDCSNLKWSY